MQYLLLKPVQPKLTALTVSHAPAITNTARLTAQ